MLAVRVFEVLLSLGGVIIGGVIGLGGTYLQTKKQQDIRRREEVLPVAGRALAAAEEAYQAIGEYESVVAIPSHNPNETLQMKQTAMIQRRDAHQKLRVALHEVSLLIRGIEDESYRLREAVSWKNRGEGNVYSLEKEYDDAREAFLERVRQFLGT